MKARSTSVLTLALTAVLLGSAAFASIAGSKHDFTATGGTPIAGVTQICVTCHWPHRPIQNVPLWSHTLAGAANTFDLYDQNASYSGLNSANYPGTPQNFANTQSRACLSCHDGTVAVAGATFVTSASVNWMLWDAGLPVAGGGAGNNGLMGSHPVGVTYAGLLPAAEWNAIPAGDEVKLDAGKVQCTSCHNAHAPFPKMLVKSNAGSALCTTCHNK